MKIFLTAAQIQTRIAELAEVIGKDYENRSVTIVGVLTGSLIFLADLIRLLNLHLKVGFIQASSYRGATTDPGDLRVGPELLPDVRDHHVLLLDDILDTGHTLVHLRQHFKTLGVASLKIGVLLRKLGRQKVAVEPDYVGFEIPDAFVIGYGLDYNDEYRHLPYIAEWSDELARK